MFHSMGYYSCLDKKANKKGRDALSCDIILAAAADSSRNTKYTWYY